MSTKGKNIYFIRPVGMLGPIKIGCSTSVGERLDNLAIWSPFKLEVIHTEPGDYRLEQQIHRAFADYHSHREWFHPGERLLRSIGKLLSGEKIATAIDLSDNHGRIRNVARKPRRPVPEYQKELKSFQMRIMWAQRRVSQQAGQSMFAPSEVRQIILAWEGTWRAKRMDGKRPTEDQFRLLHEFLDHPERLCETREQRRAKISEAA